MTDAEIIAQALDKLAEAVAYSGTKIANAISGLQNSLRSDHPLQGGNPARDRAGTEQYRQQGQRK